MNKKVLMFSLLALTIFTAVGVSSVSAHGWFRGGADIDPVQVTERQSQMFEEKAELLGVSVDEVKSYWVENKNMGDIIEELGIDKDELKAKMKENRQEKMQTRLQVLVDGGIITQEQADSRLETMQDRLENGKFGGHRMGGKFMRDGDCPFVK